MAFGKADFSGVSDENLEKLKQLEDEWKESGDLSKSVISTTWQQFYHEKIEPLTRGVFYDMEDLEVELLIRRRNQKINQLIYG